MAVSSLFARKRIDDDDDSLEYFRPNGRIQVIVGIIIGNQSRVNFHTVHYHRPSEVNLGHLADQSVADRHVDFPRN